MAGFFRDFSLTTVSTALITLIAFINNIIVTRQIGPQGRGQYAIISNLVMLISLLLGEGIRKNNVLLVPEYKNKLNIIISQNLIYLFLSFLFFCVIFLLRDYWNQILPNISDQLLVLGLIITLFTIFWQSFQALYLGLQNILFYNIVQILPIAFTFFLNLIGIYFYNISLTGIILNLLIGSLLTSIISLLHFKNSLKFQLPIKSSRKQSYSIIFKSTLSASLFFLIFRGDIFIVNFFLGSVPAGIYSVAVLFSEMLQKIPNVAGPLLISKSVQENYENSILNASRLSRVIFFLNFFAIIVLIFFGKDIIILLFGVKFNEAFPVLLCLLPALFFFGSGCIFYSYFISKSYPLAVIIINGFISIINIGLNILLVPQYGIKGAALISSATYFIWTLLFAIYFHKQTKIPLSEIFIIQKKDFQYLFGYLRF